MHTSEHWLAIRDGQTIGNVNSGIVFYCTNLDPNMVLHMYLYRQKEDRSVNLSFKQVNHR